MGSIPVSDALLPVAVDLPTSEGAPERSDSPVDMPSHRFTPSARASACSPTGGGSSWCQPPLKISNQIFSREGEDFSAGDPRLSPVPAKVIDHPLREPRQGTHPATHEPRGSHGPPQR